MGPTPAPPLVEPTAPARVSLLGFLGQRAVYLPCQHLPASPLSLGSRSALASLWGPGRGTRSQALHLDRTQAQGASLDSELLRVSATPSLRPPSSELGVCSQHGLNPQGRKLPAKGQGVNIWGLCWSQMTPVPHSLFVCLERVFCFFNPLHLVCVCVSHCHVRRFATPWTIACHGVFHQDDWSGLPFPSPGDLPDPGTELGSPALQADSLLSEPLQKPPLNLTRPTNQIWPVVGQCLSEITSAFVKSRASRRTTSLGGVLTFRQAPPRWWPYLGYDDVIIQ